jgi:hypothetical protein
LAQFGSCRFVSLRYQRAQQLKSGGFRLLIDSHGIAVFDFTFEDQSTGGQARRVFQQSRQQMGIVNSLDCGAPTLLAPGAAPLANCSVKRVEIHLDSS